MNEDSPPMPDAEVARLTATAFHEAGHAVMAMIVDRPVQKVTITPTHGPLGGVRLGVCKMKKGRLKASKDWLEDDVLILLAGMVAEARFTGAYCNQGAATDLRAVRRLLQNRGGSERQIERLERRLLDKTEHLLSDERYAAAIARIAQELMEHATLSGRAVRHWFDQAENTK